MEASAVEKLLLLVQTLSLVAIVVYTINTRRQVRAQTYFTIGETINSENNLKEIEHLRKVAQEKEVNTQNWTDDARHLARVISNRYQIIAHMLSRRFLDKLLFFENFSGTLMNVWNLCSPAIHERRQGFGGSTYERHDLELLALESWEYQRRTGFQSILKVVSDSNTLTLIEPPFTRADVALVERRKRALKRRSLMVLRMKHWYGDTP